MGRRNSNHCLFWIWCVQGKCPATMLWLWPRQISWSWIWHSLLVFMIVISTSFETTICLYDWLFPTISLRDYVYCEILSLSPICTMKFGFVPDSTNHSVPIDWYIWTIDISEMRNIKESIFILLYTFWIFMLQW